MENPLLTTAILCVFEFFLSRIRKIMYKLICAFVVFLAYMCSATRDVHCYKQRIWDSLLSATPRRDFSWYRFEYMPAATSEEDDSLFWQLLVNGVPVGGQFSVPAPCVDDAVWALLVDLDELDTAKQFSRNK